jgi:hypothetical protein
VAVIALASLADMTHLGLVIFVSHHLRTMPDTAVVTSVFAVSTANVNELFQKLIFSLPMKETSKLELKT